MYTQIWDRKVQGGYRSIKVWGRIEKDRYTCTCPWGLSPEASAPITVLRLAFAAFISIHRY
jgi:hypothetical protein